MAARAQEELTAKLAAEQTQRQAVIEQAQAAIQAQVAAQAQQAADSAATHRQIRQAIDNINQAVQAVRDRPPVIVYRQP